MQPSPLVMILRSPHGRTLQTAQGPIIVGVINVTPDSFVRESRARSVAAVVRRARRMLAEGATVIEIGGESTGPGSRAVSLREEMRRVIPALSLVRTALPDAWISVDTWKAPLARAAIDAGADIINDITAGRGDRHMFSVAASTGALIVLMYAKDASPRTTIAPRQYRDVVAVVRRFFEQRLAAADAAGIARSSCVLDPGLGHFVSSDPRYSFALLAHLEKFADLAPIMVSPSRKSFLAGDPPVPPTARLPATIGATLAAVYQGASLVRTHDVAAVARALSAFMAGLPLKQHSRLH